MNLLLVDLLSVKTRKELIYTSSGKGLCVSSCHSRRFSMETGCKNSLLHIVAEAFSYKFGLVDGFFLHACPSVPAFVRSSVCVVCLFVSVFVR